MRQKHCTPTLRSYRHLSHWWAKYSNSKQYIMAARVYFFSGIGRIVSADRGYHIPIIWAALCDSISKVHVKTPILVYKNASPHFVTCFRWWETWTATLMCHLLYIRRGWIYFSILLCPFSSNLPLPTLILITNHLLWIPA